MLGAHRLLLEAFETDVRPLLARLRERARRRGRPGRRRSARGGHAERLARERGTAHVESAYERSERRVRIALFVTCIGDTISPEVGRRRPSRCSSGSGTRSVFPAEQTCCGQMHVNSGYRDEALALARRFVEVFGAVRGGRRRRRRRASAWCATSIRLACSARARAERALDRVFELSELLVQPARRRGRRRLVPAPRHLPPDLPLAARDARRRRAAAAARAAVRGLELVELPARRGVLRLRRHVRGQERRHVERDARRQVRARSRRRAPRSAPRVDGSCLLQIGGGLSRRGAPVRTLHLAEILARRR